MGQSGLVRILPRLVVSVGILASSFLIMSASCDAADLVFVRGQGSDSKAEQELETAARYYGVNVRPVIAGAGARAAALRQAVKSKATVAVVIAGSALAVTDQETLLRALRERELGSVPVLVLGVTPEIEGDVLTAWSGGAVRACRRAGGLKNVRYRVGDRNPFTGELANLDVPVGWQDATYFVGSSNSTARQIAQIQADRQVFPVFIQTTVDHQAVYFSCEEPGPEQLGAVPVARLFASVAPVMMFVKSAAGMRGWHVIHHYANLTIDDPWLRTHYGSLDYGALLGQMEAHNFHTTIAFIPWNYARSEPEVVALFRSHPDRFSISVHGDNHDHKEFTSYARVPYFRQVAAIRQALARMDRFESLTGIPYDRVMVFPHSIAPEKTLEVLKRYDFLATVNSSNVPMDQVPTADPADELRAVTLSYGGIPSLRRYSVEGPILPGTVAVEAFLGNPLLFYGHESFFASGIGAFDAEVDALNKMQPDTLWRSLGEIVRHLYVVKLREDGGYDVRAFTATCDLENTTAREATFHFISQVTTQPKAVTVGGEPWHYKILQNTLLMEIPIAPGAMKTVVIRYGNRTKEPASIVSESSIRDTFLRTASDFRDLVLGQTAIGRRLIRLYYDDRRNFALVCLLGFTAVVAPCIWLAWRLQTRRSRARSRNAASATVAR